MTKIFTATVIAQTDLFFGFWKAHGVVVDGKNKGKKEAKKRRYWIAHFPPDRRQCGQIIRPQELELKQLSQATTEKTSPNKIITYNYRNRKF